MTSYDVLLMVIDFLFLSASAAFVFSTAKATLESEYQSTSSKCFSLLIFTTISLGIPILLYFIYLWFMEMTVLERIDFYIGFYRLF